MVSGMHFLKYGFGPEPAQRPKHSFVFAPFSPISFADAPTASPGATTLQYNPLTSTIWTPYREDADPPAAAPVKTPTFTLSMFNKIVGSKLFAKSGPITPLYHPRPCRVVELPNALHHFEEIATTWFEVSGDSTQPCRSPSIQPTGRLCMSASGEVSPEQKHSELNAGAETVAAEDREPVKRYLDGRLRIFTKQPEDERHKNAYHNSDLKCPPPSTSIPTWRTKRCFFHPSELEQAKAKVHPESDNTPPMPSEAEDRKPPELPTYPEPTQLLDVSAVHWDQYRTPSPTWTGTTINLFAGGDEEVEYFTPSECSDDESVHEDDYFADEELTSVHDSAPRQ